MKRWHAKSLEREERAQLLDAITRALRGQALTFGQALRFLRAEYLSMSRSSYAEMVGLSSGALAKLERDDGNPTVQTLNQAFQPFGYRVGLVPMTSSGSAAPALPDERYNELLAAIEEVLSLNPRGRCNLLFLDVLPAGNGVFGFRTRLRTPYCGENRENTNGCKVYPQVSWSLQNGLGLNCADGAVTVAVQHGVISECLDPHQPRDCEP